MSNSNQLTVLQYASRDFMALPKDLRQRGQNLMWELEKSAEAFDAFIAEVKQEVERRRDEAHEAAVLAVRQQMEVVEEVQQKVEKAEFRAMTARNALSTANAQLSLALNSKPSRYPTKPEIAAHEDAVRMARDIYEELNQKAIQAGALPQTARQALAQEQFTLRELEEKEFELRPKQEQKPSPIGGLGWSGIAGPTNSYGLGGEI